MPQIFGFIILLILAVLLIIYVILPLAGICLGVGFVLGCFQAVWAWLSHWWLQCVSDAPPIPSPNVSTPT